MHVLDRPEFMPPPPPGLMRAFSLALLAHLLLVVALTFAVNWKHQPEVVSVSAELWSAVPHEAAPKLVEVPPEPPAPPKPAPKVEAPKPDPALAEAEINLKKEKKRKEDEKLRLEQEKKRELAKKEAEKKEAEKKELEKQEKLKKEKKLADEKKQLEDKKLAQEKKRKEDAKREEETKALEKLRQDNLKRIAGLAGATGGTNATGSAQVSSGPSASYAGRIVARIKPNIVLPPAVSGNPRAEVEVRTAPDGTIVGRKLIQSSGVPAWDEAVLRGIDKTETLPRDIDGRVPASLVIGFRPLD